MFLLNKQWWPMCYLKSCWEPHASHPVHFPRSWLGSPKRRCFRMAGRGEWLSEGCGLKLTGAQAQLRNLLDLTLGKWLYSVPHFRRGDVECPLLDRAVVKIQWDNAHKPGTTPDLQNGRNYWHHEVTGVLSWHKALGTGVTRGVAPRHCSCPLPPSSW